MMQRNRHPCNIPGPSEITAGADRPGAALTRLLDGLVAENLPASVLLPVAAPSSPNLETLWEAGHFTCLPAPRFTLVLDGEYRTVSDLSSPHADRVVRPGQMLWIPAGERNLTRRDSRRMVLSIVFRPQFTRCLWYHHPGDGCRLSPPPQSLHYHTTGPAGPELRGMLALMDAAAASTRLHARLADTARALLAWCLQELADDAGREPGDASPLFRQISAHVADHLQDELSREQVARLFRISPDHLTRLFRLHTRGSFVSFVRDERLRLAEKLLGDPRLSVKEVATACGFNAPWYFIRRFRERHGATPQEWRRTAAPAS